MYSCSHIPSCMLLQAKLEAAINVVKTGIEVIVAESCSSDAEVAMNSLVSDKSANDYAFTVIRTHPE
jgi:hypothetical protein